MDESNKFYIANFNNQKVKCIQNELNFDSKTTKVFRLTSSNTHEQYIFDGSQDWLNGFEIKNYGQNLIESKNPMVFSFYAQKRNEIFMVEWKQN